MVCLFIIKKLNIYFLFLYHNFNKMALILGIGVVGLISYGIKFVSDEASKEGIEKNKERKRHLDDVEKRLGSEARFREEEHLRMEDRRREEEQRQKDEDWKYDIFNPGGHQF